MVNLLNIFHICKDLDIQKIQIWGIFEIISHIWKRFIHSKNFAPVNFSSHLQKIQLFGRFNCGESLEYFSHLQRFRHSKDSTTRKCNFKFRPKFKYNLFHFTPLHPTSLHLHCLPQFMPLRATSFRLPFCLGHFAPPSVIFASLHLTSCHFTSPPILSASIHANSLCLLFSSHHFTPLHATSLCLTFFLHHFTSLCATLLCLPSLFPASLHATSLHPTLSTSLHATLCHFTSPPIL